jgi:hypothetical protein
LASQYFLVNYIFTSYAEARNSSSYKLYNIVLFLEEESLISPCASIICVSSSINASSKREKAFIEDEKQQMMDAHGEIKDSSSKKRTILYHLYY